MEYGVTDSRSPMRDDHYGVGWEVAELLLFLILTVLTAGMLLIPTFLINLNTSPAGRDEKAFPWETRNTVGYIKYSSSLKGRWKSLQRSLGLHSRTPKM